MVISTVCISLYVSHPKQGSFTSPPTITRHRGDSVAIEPNEDSFIGFTDAADALALQKSVIGLCVVILFGLMQIVL